MKWTPPQSFCSRFLEYSSFSTSLVAIAVSTRKTKTRAHSLEENVGCRRCHAARRVCCPRAACGDAAAPRSASDAAELSTSASLSEYIQKVRHLSANAKPLSAKEAAETLETRDPALAADLLLVLSAPTAERHRLDRRAVPRAWSPGQRVPALQRRVGPEPSRRRGLRRAGARVAGLGPARARRWRRASRHLLCTTVCVRTEYVRDDHAGTWALLGREGRVRTGVVARSERCIRRQ